MGFSEELEGKKRLAAAYPVRIPFKISKDQVEGKYVLTLTKPDEPEWERGSQIGAKELVPKLCVSAANKHALNIMCNLNHTNIRWMKALGECCGELSAFVEPCDGTLYPDCMEKLHDKFFQMPSQVFQMIARELIEVIDFLRINDTCHGNLNWGTTLRGETYTVKVCGFQQKDIAKILAQWEDCAGIAEMLQTISDRARQFNEERPVTQLPLIYGDLDGLIDVINQSNMDELSSMKEKTLGNPFLWNKAKRFKLMMNDVPALRRNRHFRRGILGSDICELPWDSNDNNRHLCPSLAKRFKVLLDKCNSYRSELNTKNEYSASSYDDEEEEEEEEKKKIKPFRTDKKMDLISLSYALYTHEAKLQDDVDYVFLAKFSKFFSELHRVISSIPAW